MAPSISIIFINSSSLAPAKNKLEIYKNVLPRPCFLPKCIKITLDWVIVFLPSIRYGSYIKLYYLLLTYIREIHSKFELLREPLILSFWSVVLFGVVFTDILQEQTDRLAELKIRASWLKSKAKITNV